MTPFRTRTPPPTRRRTALAIPVLAGTLAIEEDAFGHPVVQQGQHLGLHWPLERDRAPRAHRGRAGRKARRARARLARGV